MKRGLQPQAGMGQRSLPKGLEISDLYMAALRLEVDSSFQRHSGYGIVLSSHLGYTLGLPFRSRVLSQSSLFSGTVQLEIMNHVF